MALTPMYDSVDPQFNADAARAAFELVMKMDDEEARAFTTMVVVDTLWETIEKNQRTLQRHLTNVVSKQAKAASTVFERHGQEELSKVFEEISKAPTHTPYYYGYQFDENKINRDPHSGQFRIKVRYSTNKPIPDRHAKRVALPTAGRTGLSGERLAHYQQAYGQVSDFLQNFQQNGLGGDTDFIYTVADDDGNQSTFRHAGAKMPTKANFDPETERIVAVEARPSGLNVGGAAFGLVGALGGNEMAQSQAGAYGNRVEAASKPFYNAWTAGAEDATSSNARLYNRVAAGSDFVGAVAPFGSKLQLAAKFGSIVGQHGPQAEKVIGPRIRTTMYRYRGTEKTPDRELASAYNRALSGYDADSITPEAQKALKVRQTRRLAAAQNAKGSELTSAERAQVIAAVNREGLGLSGASDSGAQSEAGKYRAWSTAREFLERKVPKKNFYDLNLKSGHTPPSEGIIIDSSGKIVTQAVGYGDDHYLPFNLRNLSGLKGGEYIRTRSVGGPTSEDIYTGLVTGAQRITVISRSGTFVVTFDDTFRGSRRYNDKAGRMVGRYEKLLDAIKSKQVSRADVEPSVKRKIAQDVEDEYGDWTPMREKRKVYTARLNEYKAYPSVSEEDEANIDTQLSRHSFNTEGERNAARADLRNQLMESKAFNYDLNGDGYEAALRALEEQFPYYIADVKVLPKYNATHFENEPDKGYVKPRYNRPEQALEGFYDTSIQGTPAKPVTNVDGEPTGKYSADSADFQNWKYNKQNSGSMSRGSLTPVKEGVQGQDPAHPESTEGEPSIKELAEDKMARQKHEATQLDAAIKVKHNARTRIKQGEEAELAEWLNLDDEAFGTWFKNPANQKKFNVAVNDVLSQLTSRGIEARLLTEYTAARGLVGGEPWDPARHLGSVPANPYEFKGRPYVRSKDTDIKKRELSRRAKETPVPGFPPLDQLTKDEEFRDALKAAQQIRELAGEASQSPNPAAYIAAVNGEKRGISGSERYLKNPAQADKLVENINRAWRLRRNLDEANAAAAPAATPENTKPAAAAAGPTGTKIDYKPKGQAMVLQADLTIMDLAGDEQDELQTLRDDLNIALNADDDEAINDAGHAIYEYFSQHPDVGKVWMKHTPRNEQP